MNYSLPKIIDLRDFWITNDGDLVRYEFLDETHAENLLKFLRSKRQPVPQKLLDRVEFFKQNRNKLKSLF